MEIKMDKNEMSFKMDEFKDAMHSRDFHKAVELADQLELKKIKDNSFLSLVADAYELTHNYKEAKKVLLLAYENTNAGRHLAYRLCLISIKNKEYDEAEEYYEDFVEMAPRDTSRYILKYKMAKAKGQPIEKLIEILEQYVNIDMEEKWAYELAKLYHMAGDEEKCVDMCDEISLWFADGKYVNKAMELKKKYCPLTSAQQQKYEENKVKNEDNAVRQEKKQMEKPLKTLGGKELELVSSGKKESASEDEKKSESEVEIQNSVSDGGKKENSIPVNNNEVTEIKLEKEEDKEKPDKMDDQPITDIKGVEDMLRQLQERGILKAETVSQAVNIIGETEKKENKIKDPSDMLTRKREVQNRKAEERTKNNGGIKLNVVEPPKTDAGDKAKPVEGEKAKQSVEETKRIDVESIKNAVKGEEKAVKKQEVSENEIETVAETEPEEIKTDVRDVVESKEIKTDVREAVEPEEIKTESEAVAEPEGKKTETTPVMELEAMDDEDVRQIFGRDGTVPVFDLSVDPPARDSSKDIGRENMYENIVANSNMGRNTDRLPGKEEIEEAVKQAEEAMKTEPETEQKTEPETEPETEQNESETADAPDSGIHSHKDLSAKVEIISGTDWEQPNPETEKPEEKTAEKLEEKTDEKPVEKAEEETEGTEESTGAGETAKEPETESEKNSLKESVKEEEEKSDKDKVTIPEETRLTLTAEEMEVFKNYLNVEGFEENIENILKDMIVDYVPNGKSDNCNIVIMGGKQTGKSTLGIELIKLINKKRGRRNRKLAKVKARALNRRGFRNSLNKLLGCDLIVEEAQELGAMTLSEIVDASGMFTDDMLIFLEGETEGMEKILKDAPRVSTVFDHVIRIKEYNIKEWVEYGIKYASTKGYGVDELAHLAFYKAVDDFFGNNQGIEQKDVEAIVDEAIAKSKRIGRKLTGIFASRKDEDGLDILVESDFNV